MIKERLRQQMFLHREKLGLKQREVAELLGKSEKTYGLSDIFDILEIFQVLHFSTTEIVNVLGFPPLTLSEVTELYQDEEILKSIRENAICSTIRQTCGKMETSTIERLIFTLMKEQCQRKGNSA